MGNDLAIAIGAAQIAMAGIAISGIPALLQIRRRLQGSPYKLPLLSVTALWLLAGPVLAQALSRWAHSDHHNALELMHSPIANLPLAHLYLANAVLVAVLCWLFAFLLRKHGPTPPGGRAQPRR